MGYETLIVEKRGHVGWLIFNRPESLPGLVDSDREIECYGSRNFEFDRCSERFSKQGEHDNRRYVIRTEGEIKLELKPGLGSLYH